ncbi:uncharacterized protein PHALS_13480 [Plasmopara halstedii]|uniref:Uncharacterized protein n=1 Tax=Plasmopara halstedii TaxID=4781 RepID=A0A0P1AQE0_PLAHL|nr:uncharacterized protein PHALS_13480 [Plasmopara halstedii]CEG43276.1 hypothetical protein PHALS_13480 [Plasmopara halstedii]|eukprot:XP_024579645.1 hypothetical protein PHALS_13480 [Plasmopara halstedii]
MISLDHKQGVGENLRIPRMCATTHTVCRKFGKTREASFIVERAVRENRSVPLMQETVATLKCKETYFRLFDKIQ